MTQQSTLKNLMTKMNANGTQMSFDQSVVGGTIAEVVAGGVSTLAVAAFLAYLIVYTLYRRTVRRTSLMGDSSMTAYFYSLLLANLFKSMSVFMSVRWLSMDNNVFAGDFCTTQAVLKLVGNVGSSVWSMVIAIHVFNLLFLNLKSIRWGMPAVVIAVWSILGFTTFLGPVFIDKSKYGFYGPDDELNADFNGSFCWIRNHHPKARFLLEYLPTGLTLFVTTLLLSATLLHLRGNLYFTNSRLKVRWVNSEDAWHNKMMRDAVDRTILATVSRMVVFPLSYFVLWAPVMVSRLMSLSGDKQPFGFVAFSLTTYALTGLADVLLFVVGRRVILPDGVLTPIYADVDAKNSELYEDEKKTSPVSAPPAYPRALLLRSDTKSSGSSYSSRGPPTTVSQIFTGPRYAPSALDSASSRPTNFLSMGSDTPPYAEHGIITSYAQTTASTGFDIGSAAVHSDRCYDVNTTTSGAASFATYAKAASAAGLVAPLEPAETYKAKLYGARFSLVAGPAPAFNLDRDRVPMPIENRI